uniref:Probable lipid II flippase MurJ n=1 Tax=Candidatus Aschnera chinzeii TaxID=1485666 RepID=A0AAT9G4A1_9ENTR|nr:MAG: murein biosynthesis integral membrane protein MurJ [Candidatus Aschnera chinzeii]
MKLFKSLAAISIMTMCSRILGFVRDTLIARFFGAGMVTDAFFVAFRLPNLLRRIFAEGVFSQVLIPILIDYKNNRQHHDTAAFIAHISGMLILILSVIIFLGILTAPYIIYVSAPGFIQITNKFELTVKLLRIMFPYILLISLSSLISSILNTWNMFFIPAIAPSLLNICIIIAIIFFAPYCNPSIIALAFGVIIGGIIQLCYQLPYLYKIHMLILPFFSLYNKKIWNFFKLISPAIITILLNQISFIINTIFASYLEEGAISWIYYADRLMEFPIGMLGVSLSTILLPSLAKEISIGKYENYRHLIDSALRLCCLFSFPCAIGLIILAKPLIITLFQYGNFNSYDSLMTQKVLIAYSIGIISLMFNKILVTIFYSKKDLKTPVKIACYTLLFTQIINIILFGPLKHVALALSISLGSCINTLILYRQLRYKLIFIPLNGWTIFLGKLLISLFVMILILLVILNIMPMWESVGMYHRIIRLLAVSCIGFITYCFMLFLLKIRLHDFF